MKTERSELNNKPPEDAKIFSRPRNKENINTSESTLNKSNISITESQGRQGQLLSQDSVENVLTVSSQTELTIDNSFNTASTMSMSEKSIKLFTTCYCQGIHNTSKRQIHNSNIRPTKQYLMTRDNQNKKYEDSLKLQIRKLTQEIADISDDIENKKKQYFLICHHVENKQSTDELSDIQNQFSSNNISAISNESEIKVDSEEDDENIIELMDPKMRREYLELIEKKKELQQKIKKEQLEIDVIMDVKMSLEEQIELLSTQVFKVVEEKTEPEQNRINYDNERKQDDLEIVVNKQEKEGNDRQTKDQQRLEKFKADSTGDQFELVITDDALIKEIHERIAAFENKLDEIMEAHNDLENFIRKNREQMNLNQLEDKVVESIKRIMNFQDRTID